MVPKIEITIEVIIHATEDINKFFYSFTEIFGLEESKFSHINLLGHFENPITIIKTKITKKDAQKFVKMINEKIPKEQMDEIIDNFEERLSDSGFHLRLDKQEFIKGRILVGDSDAIKIRIYTPVFNKKEFLRTYLDLFEVQLD